MSGVGVSRALAPAITVPGSDQGMGDTGWLHSNGDRNRSSERSFPGGRWVQITYAIIDILRVIVSGVLTFSFRFSAVNLYHSWLSGRIKFRVSQVPPPYAGFLFLYIALILLFCQWQSLYRTLRTRSAQ